MDELEETIEQSVVAQPVLPGKLPEAEIESIAARLRVGLPLDERYRPLLFHRTREAELAYAAKEPRGSVLAQTMGRSVTGPQALWEPRWRLVRQARLRR